MEALILIPMGMAIGGTFGAVVLGPILKPDPDARNRPFRFFLGDLLWLFCLLHLPLVLLGAAAMDEGKPYVPVTVVLLLTAIGLWCLGIRILSQFGVRQTLRRGVFLTILLPMGVYGSIAVAVVAISTLTVLTEMVTASPSHGDDLIDRLWWLLLVLIPAVAVGCRWLAGWVRRGGDSGCQ